MFYTEEDVNSLSHILHYDISLLKFPNLCAINIFYFHNRTFMLQKLPKAFLS